MKITLSDGREAILQVSHRLGKGVTHDKQGRRHTTVTLVVPNGDRLEDYVGRALCSPKDNFCRRIGRKKAVTRLCQEANLSKPDRRSVWAAVCPEFYKQPARMGGRRRLELCKASAIVSY